MFDYLMTPEQLKLRDETRELVKSLPREYILDMDAEKSSTLRIYAGSRPP